MGSEPSKQSPSPSFPPLFEAKNESVTALASQEFGITVTGVMVASLSGFLMGTGYSFLINKKADPRNDLPAWLQLGIGGSFFVCGLYLFAPKFLRDAWLYS
eukprot:TRINITY_DN1624_c0_g1_i1.p1 TRINITY_DN1624_c0_g1~~TRINITY_DN1624_c0_g1_i1.p1  ORF type:complete len:101 (+),score=14.60 TRINITY_DN1624_c0_g1_i1:80-382(+)